MLRNTKRIVLSYGLLALSAAAPGGCQRGPTWNLSLVEGTVTNNGRPLRGMEVIFLADPDAGTEGPRTRGITDAAGHYRLRTDNGDNGAVVGKYRVVVIDIKDSMMRRGSSVSATREKKGEQRPREVTKHLEMLHKIMPDQPRVSPSYGDFSKTPLRIEVHPGPQVIDLDVKGNDIEAKLIGIPGKM